MQALKGPKEQKVVELHPHHHMRESGGPRVGENMCIGGSGEEGNVGICI